MMDHDAFSQWMDVKVLDIKEGYSKIQMTIRKEMVNGFGIVHGGLPFSLADSAFAFACSAGPEAIMSGTDTKWITGAKSRTASYVTFL